MATIKTTKKDNFNAILAILATVDVANKAELTEFITHEIDLLDKKSANAKTKPSKAQAENDGIKTAIIEAFKTADVAMTITEFQTAYPDFAEYSNQKMSALFKQLVDNGTLAKTVVKKKSYFALATVDEDTDTEEVGENAENSADNG